MFLDQRFDLIDISSTASDYRGKGAGWKREKVVIRDRQELRRYVIGLAVARQDSVFVLVTPVRGLGYENLEGVLSTFILKSCRNRAGNVELLGVAEGQLRDEEDLLEVEPRCDHLLAEGGEIVLVSAADFLE